MRILFFSDWRIQPVDIIFQILNDHKKIDLVLYGGDDVERFCDAANKLNLFTEMSRFTKYGFGGVLGNDCLERNREFLIGKRCLDLHETPMKAGKYGIVGIEGSIYHMSLQGNLVNGIGYVTHSDDDVSKHICKNQSSLNIESTNLILVSHTPPYKCLDQAIRFGKEHIGSPSLRSFIEEQQPILVLCGHVHSQGGKVETIGNTTIINAASDDQNAKDGRVALITLDEIETKVEWIPLDNYLLGFPGIGPKRFSHLLELGITEPKQLFDLSDVVLCNLDIGISKKSISKFRSIQQSRLEGKHVYIPGSLFKLPEKAIYYDVETDLSHDPWMICAVSDTGEVFQQYELDRVYENRKKMYRNFLEFLSRFSDEHILVSYSGCGFDRGAIREGLKNNHIIGLEEWERKIQFDPIHQLKNRFVLKQTYNYGLKSFSKLFGFTLFEEEKLNDITGLQVGIEYEKYLIGENKTFSIEKLKKYNLLDVKALIHVVTSLKKINEGYAFDFYENFDMNYLKSEQDIYSFNELVQSYVMNRVESKSKSKHKTDDNEKRKLELQQLSKKLNVSQRAIKKIGLVVARNCNTKEDVEKAIKYKK